MAAAAIIGWRLRLTRLTWAFTAIVVSGLSQIFILLATTVLLASEIKPKPQNNRLDLLSGDAFDALKASFSRPGDLDGPAIGQNEAFDPDEANPAILGRQLFFEPKLSKNGKIACATCHNPAHGWETPFAKPLGVTGQPLQRHAPTLLGVGAARSLLWDGSAPTLDDQALGPLTHPDEMGSKIDDILKWLGETRPYKRAFETAFGSEPTQDALLSALSAYQRQIWPAKTDFDRWIDGDTSALSKEAQEGFVLFNTKAQCAACHAGWLLTDHRFHDIGLETDDPGRGRFEPGDERRMHAFKTPTLRHINKRAPYMHHGGLSDLNTVLDHYNKGGLLRENQSPLIVPLGLTEGERKALLAFLETL